MSRYAVIGKPVKHSKSPQIHTLFAKQTGQDLSYSAEEVEEEDFESYVASFFSGGGGGLNITVPHKERAFAVAKLCSDRANLARAVNTLYLDQDGHLCGDNTDGAGLVRDITENHRFEIRNKRILLLGAGGAVRGVLAVLAEQQPASITLVNRTLSRAQQLQREFVKLVTLKVQSYEGLQEQVFDLVINGTSSSLSGELPPISPAMLAAQCCCYDMMYSDQDTAFVAWSKAQGATLALDGIGMLVEQAAESFEIWRGVRPATTQIIDGLRAK